MATMKANPQTRFELISWNQFYSLARRLASRIRQSGFRPDTVVAIARGGYVPGRILCDFLGVANLVSFRVEHYLGRQMEKTARILHPIEADLSGQCVLIVDDLTDSGDTFRVATAHLRERAKPAEIRTAALHFKTVSSFAPDFYAQKVIKWRWISYPWARIEDIAGLAKAMEPPPADPDELSEWLWRNHALRLPDSTLQDVLVFLAGAAPSEA